MSMCPPAQQVGNHHKPTNPDGARMPGAGSAPTRGERTIGDIIKSGMVEQQQKRETVVVSGKPSNPKDSIGIRKVAFSVLPWRVLYRIALGMMEGAAKYGRHNYRAVGCRASVYFDATVGRHIGPWWEGEDIDPESGEHHIDKAITSLMVMRDSMLEGNFVDDRPPRGNVDLPELNGRAGAILDRHADKSPRHYTIADTAELSKTPPLAKGPAAAEAPFLYHDGKHMPIQLAPDDWVEVNLRNGTRISDMARNIIWVHNSTGAAHAAAVDVFSWRRA